AGVEPLGGAALMRFARVLRLLAPDDARLPWLRPERLQLDRVLVDADRVPRIARNRPRADLRAEIGEGVFRHRAAGQAAGDRYRGRAGNDVADLLAVEQRQRVDQDDATDAVAHQF